ncbi:MAG: PEGA domain-containing protein, partial [Kofleriaceae bacterium]
MERITVVSADAVLAEKLTTALTAVGTVDTRATVSASPAGLHVIHVDGDPTVVERARPCRVIAVLARGSLGAIVDMMATSDAVIGMVTADDFDPGELAAMAARAISRRPFGLDRLLPGARIHHRTVRDHADKSTCSAHIAELVQRDVPRAYHAPIEQCLDEMLTNALYDAPVDEHGRQVFGELSARDRMTAWIDQRVDVHYACDGRRFAIAVRDGFGSLERGVVLRVLHKCLHASQPVDRRVSGAGLGLYLMATSSTAIYFSVVPGLATEVTCVFELASEARLARFGFFLEATDETGQLPVRSHPAKLGRRPRPGLVVAALATVAAAIGGFAMWRLTRPDPVPLSLPRTAATLTLATQPAGAAVTIDGKPMGGAPVVAAALAPGSTVLVTFALRGYRPAQTTVQVPAAGDIRRVLQPLERSSDLVRVHFVSTPPGARIVGDGATSHTYTPAYVFVEANKLQRFTLTMPKHAPFVIEPFTAQGADVIEKSAV